jgi:hypothetical protein
MEVIRLQNDDNHAQLSGKALHFNSCSSIHDSASVLQGLHDHLQNLS